MLANAVMKAAVLESYAEPFKYTEISRPIAKQGEVLVRIKASGVNPLDIKIQAGKADHARTKLPAVLGIDLAGVVESVGASVESFHVGDEVYGMTGGIGGIQGSLAEFAAVDADLLALKPQNLMMREAAALPLIFITAWEGLVDKANTREGQKVLIQGGSGGVGHIAVQLARALGASVFATGSASNKRIIEGFGATAIDYRTMTVEQYVAAHTDGLGFDVIYDTAGGATLDASFAAAKYYEGHVISILGWGKHSLAPLSFRAATYSGVFTLLPLLTGKGRAHHGEILREATKLIEAGKLKPNLDSRRFNLQTVQDAYEVIESCQARGKIIVDITE
ncbi:zinc-dependent alcohol dehydrogenase family protein [Paenibacillus frigoriresistens]|uniref:zinc-dependent alcohol dehydrogenase family protein n=1 Tax=Paenibacillus alginolyticus TaxID=59839 RepID=UPI001566EA6B|nr:zinc-dependent alcohol dehydrogenase family protein [Paenibacillus frigoriresistens]NRF91670.1 zinc-dependent alcohol dehydrogenase family protein [Paenibacillus frigoriresistens]